MVEDAREPAPRPRFVLASQSPARLKTLRNAGVEPEVIVSGVDEDNVTAESPGELARLLACLKARAVVATLDDHATVLGCDSVLEIDGVAYGKPGTPEIARERLRMMRGRSGVLHTGHCLFDTNSKQELRELASTTVHFADLTDAEIDAYVATGEPLVVAGSFTVDGIGGPFVTGIEGDYHNVVGLSLPLLRRMLADVGIPWPSLWQPPHFAYDEAEAAIYDETRGGETRAKAAAEAVHRLLQAPGLVASGDLGPEGEDGSGAPGEFGSASSPAAAALAGSRSTAFAPAGSSAAGFAPAGSLSVGSAGAGSLPAGSEAASSSAAGFAPADSLRAGSADASSSTGFAPADSLPAGSAAASSSAAASPFLSSLRVLELAVGTGVVGAELVALGNLVHGVDLSTAMLKHARYRLPGHVAAADAARLPVGDRRCDAVVAIWLLHLLDDTEGVIAEVARVLRPGGVFITTTEKSDASRYAAGRSPKETRSGDALSHLVARGAVHGLVLDGATSFEGPVRGGPGVPVYPLVRFRKAF
ncbi:Maf family nucleotide pyrophosphatase [Kribbella sp. DT2]|uniref:Maf family nucleotide pyrophosphatase n=1 Tax=Kribbella sp. DT2 TaxID=3393427 RepID=UPI003CF5FA0B